MPDITKGKTFESGDTVTAADLNSFLDDATINNDAINADKIASGAVGNSEVSGSAAISVSKLESLSTGQLIVGNAGTPTAVAMSGDATISNTGAVTVSSSATVADNAITLAKLALGTQGDVLYFGADGAPALLGFGASGQFLKTQGTGANPVWSDIEVPALVQVVSTGTKHIYNHSSGSYASVEGTQGGHDAFYVLTDDTNTFDTTITRKRLDSKVRIEFSIHMTTNTGVGWRGKIQRSLDDGTTWVDTVVGDEGPGGASDLRARVQFGSGFARGDWCLNSTHYTYIDTPAGSTGEEAVRYRIIVGTESGYSMYYNFSFNEGTAPSGNGAGYYSRPTSNMLLTEVFV